MSRMRFALVACGLFCVRCQSCLPPLFDPSVLDVPPLPLPEPTKEMPSVGPDETPSVEPISACNDAADCEDSVDGAHRACVGNECTFCEKGQCGAGQVCCLPGRGGNLSESPSCEPGACCDDTDCAGNASGERCIGGVCGLSACTDEGNACDGGLCCNGVCGAGSVCCVSADCGGGEVCADGACVACDDGHACDMGASCCNGVCLTGGCCNASDCANPELACVMNACSACTPGGSDCRAGRTCCDDPTVGAVCLGDDQCCPNELNNTACDSSASPSQRACDLGSRSCGVCDPLTAPCAPGRTCCGGACVTPGAGECCIDADCPSDACVDNVCVECNDAGDCSSGACVGNECVECDGSCGAATSTTGVEVCADNSCVACDGAHPCGANEVCCGGLCFSGTCCESGDCAGGAPVCEDHACRNCGDDGECGSGQLCVDGNGPCAGSGCQCVAGTCHFTAAINPADCAGACCGYQCAAGGTCCDSGDCTTPNFGFDPGNVCSSAQTAPAAAICTGNTCACPAPTGSVRYVDRVLGDDALGNGSAACPKRTIGATLAPGLDVRVRPGLYDTEAFPLSIPAGTLVQRDPTCTSGTVRIVRTDAATTCPVQYGAATNCAIAITAPGAQLRELRIKSVSGRAVAFGTGADATSQLQTGIIGCAGDVADCDRGGSEGQAAREPILVAGTASPVIGGNTVDTLQIAGSLQSAVLIAEQAAPTVRNMTRFVGFDQDVIAVRDAAAPTLANLRMEWPSGALGSNLARCVSVTGSSGNVSLSQVWLRSCGTGGVLIERPGNVTLTDVRVDGAGGVPQASGEPNRKEGFGLWLDGGVAVVMNGGRMSNNRGHGAMIRGATVTLNGASFEDNGQQPPAPTACYGGNGLEINATTAVVTASGGSFSGSRGRTSPPPTSTLEACATGTGARLGRGSASFDGGRFVGNAFDGLLVESTASAASATNSVFAGNAANGVEVQGLAAANISGNNRFRECPGPVGNGRGNLCFVTPAVPATMRAQNNAWLASPPTIRGDNDPPPEIPGGPEDIVRYDLASGTNRHCGGLGAHDVIIVSSAFVFPPFINPSQVTTSPGLAPVVCP